MLGFLHMLPKKDFTIQTQGLGRTYKTYRKSEGVWKSIKGFWNRQYEDKVALHPTTLQIEGGQIVGLVGANGAGKTTLLKLLSGLIHPTEGDALVLGYHPTSRDPEYLRQMSILLGQKEQLWFDLPPADSYELLARIYGLKPSEAKTRVQELAHWLGCQELLHIQLRRLSLGERMKMELIGALLHKPRVLFLDEPTIGLDIVAQTSIREFLAHYVREEKPTVILTSHYMDDISRLADRLLLIQQGKIVYDGTVAAFTAKAESRQTLSLKILSPPDKDVAILPNWVLPAGSLSVKKELQAHQVGEALRVLMSLGSVQDIRIEESEFEDVVRAFMEQDDRLRSTRRPPTI